LRFIHNSDGENERANTDRASIGSYMEVNGVISEFLIKQSFRKYAEMFINVQNAFLRVASSQGEGHKKAE
jgi:hypothetical protein